MSGGDTQCQQCGLRKREWHKRILNERHSFDRGTGRLLVYKAEKR